LLKQFSNGISNGKNRCRFVIADFFATDLSVADLAATENPLLTFSNG
jgi:hypothetical protein